MTRTTGQDAQTAQDDWSKVPVMGLGLHWDDVTIGQ